MFLFSNFSPFPSLTNKLRRHSVHHMHQHRLSVSSSHVYATLICFDFSSTLLFPKFGLPAPHLKKGQIDNELDSHRTTSVCLSCILTPPPKLPHHLCLLGGRAGWLGRERRGWGGSKGWGVLVIVALRKIERKETICLVYLNSSTHTGLFKGKY